MMLAGPACRDIQCALYMSAAPDASLLRYGVSGMYALLRVSCIMRRAGRLVHGLLFIAHGREVCTLKVLLLLCFMALHANAIGSEPCRTAGLLLSDTQ